MLYRAAHRDPDWAVTFLLTLAVGTLRGIAVVDCAEGRRASEALAEISSLVGEKLREVGDDEP